jgi:hypothetical protein
MKDMGFSFVYEIYKEKLIAEGAVFSIHKGKPPSLV